MKLRTINLSNLIATSSIATPLATISCQQKQTPLNDAVTVKDFGYIADLTHNEILQKLLSLNPNLEIRVGELTLAILHNKAYFSINPGFQKKSKYRGDLEVKFSSYITPLYSDIGKELIIHFTQEDREFRAEFKITKDYGYGDKKIRYSTSELVNGSLIKRYEEKIEEIPNDSEYQKLIVDFELQENVIKREKVYYRFDIEEANLPEIIFEIN